MTLSYKLILLFGTVLFLNSCISDQSFELLPEDDISEEDYILYSLALNQIHQDGYIPPSDIVILQSSAMYSYSGGEYERTKHRLCNWYNRFDQEFFSDYLPLQSDIISFGAKFTTDQVNYLISQEEFDHIFDFDQGIDLHEYWKIFKEIYGDGFFNFNRILYSRTEDYALFEISYVCGGLCGYGFIVDADKIDGIWNVCVNQTWIS